ncbi:MAG: helix-turn-helix transcriptional regulator, partial [Alphaproteobacteria bacterium]
MQQEFCSPTTTRAFVEGWAMAYPTDPIDAANWLKAERAKRGWSTTNLADFARAIARREGSSIKLTQQTVSGFEQGDAKRIPEWFRYVEMAFEEGAPARQQETERRDDLVYVRQVDIRFALGDGAAIDDYPSVQLVPFNLGFIKRISTAPIERLFLASGIGNSMEPTLLKDDMVLIDTTDTRSTFGDLLWAFEWAGAGYIKRLARVKIDGRELIEMLSDNDKVPTRYAEPDDVHI